MNVVNARPLVLASLLALVVSCGNRKDEWPPEQLAFGKNVTSASEQLSLGRAVYERDCIGCHGPKGDGQGYGARFLDPKPRDFTKGIFKFAAVPAGDLPHDDDLERTLRNGLTGTSMPAWPLTPQDETDAVVAYLKTFSPRWTTKKPGAKIAATEDPYARKPDKGVEMGRKVYHVVARCWGCHAAYETPAAISADAATMGQTVEGVRANFDVAEAKKSDWGFDIKPPDFLVDQLKAGESFEDLYRDIASGIGGTAMPMWRGALTEEQLWGLVHYVKSLLDQRGTDPGAALSTSLHQAAALAQAQGTP